MVSADNLNLDVLELIFAHLSGNDLPSVACVSQSFLAGVIPRLYYTLSYQRKHAKSYSTGGIMSPFAAVLARPYLAIHVRNIEIRAIPDKPGPHPTFIRECSRTVELCRNLVSFKCPAPNIFHYFLAPLQGKRRLEALRAHAQLTSPQVELLVKLNRVEKLSIDFASWNVVDALPKWCASLQTTLTSLTLYMTNDLNEGILNATLSQLPRLRGLHIVGCPKIDHTAVFRLVSHTPLLENLSLTVTDILILDTASPPSLYYLVNLAFDTRFQHTASGAPSPLSSVLTHLRSSLPSLTSLAIKLSERKVVVPPAFIQQLVEEHGHTLRKLAFFEATVGIDSIQVISAKCNNLERLDVAVPSKDLISFTSALAQSKSLRVLVDIDIHVAHGPRLPLKRENIRFMMQCITNLSKIVSDRKTWTATRKDADDVTLSLEHRKKGVSAALWFMAQDSLNEY